MRLYNVLVIHLCVACFITDVYHCDGLSFKGNCFFVQRKYFWINTRNSPAHPSTILFLTFRPIFPNLVVAVVADLKASQLFGGSMKEK